MFPIRQAHTSLLAARGVENPSRAELPTPGAPQHGTLVGISTISQGCPWEPTVPPKGHRAGDQAGAGGHCQAQAVPTEAPCSGSGVLFLAVVWPWGSRKGDWALCPGGHSGSIPWQGGGKGHCSVRREHPALDVSYSSLLCPLTHAGAGKRVSVAGVACPQQWGSCPRTDTVGGGHRAIPQPCERAAGVHRDMLQ